MKVPKMYKSSDRYNAGTDVIYNDDSKLQYAPFIYATTESGDSGDDEEGEDAMFVNFDAETGASDKSFKDIKDAYDAGKIVALKITLDFGDDGYNCSVYYLVEFNNNGDAPNIYRADFASAGEDGEGGYAISVITLESSNVSDNMTARASDGGEGGEGGIS